MGECRIPGSTCRHNQDKLLPPINDGVMPRRVSPKVGETNGGGDKPKDLAPEPLTPEVKESVQGLVIRVKKPVDTPGFVDQLIQGVLLKGNIFEDILKEYVNKVASGEITIGPDGVKATGNITEPHKHIISAVGSVAADRLLEVKPVKKVVDKLKAIGSQFVDPITNVFTREDKDYVEIGVVVYIGVVGAVVVGGLVNYAVKSVHEAKNDTAASVMTWAANLIPEKIHVAGELEPKKVKGQVGEYAITVGHKEFEWKPSAGTWKVNAFVQGEWRVSKNVQLGGKVELSSSDKDHLTGKVSTSATYLIGSTYLDAVKLEGSAAPAGKYDLSVTLSKEFAIGKNTLDLYVGGKFSTEPGAGGRHREEEFSGTFGVKFTIGGGDKKK